MNPPAQTPAQTTLSRPHGRRRSEAAGPSSDAFAAYEEARGSGWQSVRRHRLPIVALAIASAVGAILWSLLQGSVYQTSAQVLVGPSSAGSAPSNGDLVSSSEVASQRIVATSQAVLAAASDALGGDVSVAALRRSVNVEPVAGTRVLTFTARAGTADEASAWADAVASAYADQRAQQAAASQDAVRDGLAKEGARLSGRLDQIDHELAQGGGTPDQSLLTEQRLLQSQLGSVSAQLGELSSREAPASAQVLSPATEPSSPAEPRPVFNAALAALLGLLLGVAIALVAGQRSPDPEDVAPDAVYGRADEGA